MDRIVRFLPPKNKSQGNKRVSRDLASAAQPLNAKNFANQKVQDMITKGDADGLQKVADRSKSPGFAGFEVKHFEESLHKRARDSQSGRVRGKKKTAVIGFQRWKKRRTELKRRVGTTKSPFALAREWLGGARAAGWMRNMEVTRFLDRRRDKKHPRFVVRSLLSWASNYKRQIENAMRIEEKAMKGDLRRRLRNDARKSGFK